MAVKILCGLKALSQPITYTNNDDRQRILFELQRITTNTPMAHVV